MSSGPHLRQHGFHNPTGVTCIGPGRLLVVENGRYQLVQCHGSGYQVREVAAGGSPNSKPNAGAVEEREAADQARLFCPRFAVCSSSQIVYFTDASCIRRLVLATKEVRTIAGVPAPRSPAGSAAAGGGAAAAAAGGGGCQGACDGSGQGDAVRFSAPWGLALDEDQGVLYVADSSDHAVKRVVIATGEVTTLVPAGNGLRYPVGLALHRDGEWLYCSDEGGIKRIELSSGIVSTWAGYSCGLQDGPALSAKFNGPKGIRFDQKDNLLVADRGNSCVRVVSPEGVVSTLLPGGIVTQPYDVDISHSGELVVTDAYQGVLHVFDLSLQRPDHIKVPPSCFTRRMADLLDSGDCADVTFQVGEDRIRAHKLILCTQCDYFRKLLAPDNFAEGHSGVVQVQETTPEAFHALLRSLYTDELNFSDDVILDVMLLAQKMLIHRVLNHCLLHVRHNLSPSNAAQWLMWADEHPGFGELRSTAFNYVVGNFKDVRKHREQLAALLTRRPDIALDVMMVL